MTKSEVHSVFFIGIGGIGMSALALFFKSKGTSVYGYDRVKTDITHNLVEEGIQVIYNDNPEEIDPAFFEIDKKNSLIVFTPAIPADQILLNYFIQNGYRVQKRALALADVLEEYKVLAVAGTHGKTTTCAILAHILDYSGFGCNAFLGGIANNFNSNLLINPKSNFAVVEADEFDRSFLNLSPYSSIVTCIDPDHLDVYGSAEEFKSTFSSFITSTSGEGTAILHESIELENVKNEIKYGNHSTNRVENYSVNSGEVTFNFVIGNESIQEISFCLPGIHNANNALAAAILARSLGIKNEAIKEALIAFTGVKRRFQYHIREVDLVYIDDYAHHPSELSATISAVKNLYPDKVIAGVFQPHLYTRTRDFMQEFAGALNELDKIILLEIYPAREQPLPGISSVALLEEIDNPRKQLVSKDKLVNQLKHEDFDVLLTLGAGDIDQCIDPIAKGMMEKRNLETHKR